MAKKLSDREVEHRRACAQATILAGEHRSAKLTPEKVRAIRALKDAGLTHREIAERFGIERSSVTNLLRGATWGWVR